MLDMVIKQATTFSMEEPHVNPPLLGRLLLLLLLPDDSDPRGRKAAS
jgi:hypothetical protein